MNTNNYQGGYGQGYQQSSGRKPKEEPVDETRLLGTVRAYSSNKEAPIKINTFDNGTKSTLLFIDTLQKTGKVDENGNPVLKKVSVPVSVETNKVIPEQILLALRPGMKVKAKGNHSYMKKKDGNLTLIVRAYMFEILDAQNVQQGYAQQPAMQAQQMQQGYQSPYQAQQYPPQGGYQQQMPQGYGYQQQTPPAYGQQPQQYAPQNYPPQAIPQDYGYQQQMPPAYGQQQMPPAYGQQQMPPAQQTQPIAPQMNPLDGEDLPMN